MLRIFGVVVLVMGLIGFWAPTSIFAQESGACTFAVDPPLVPGTDIINQKVVGYRLYVSSASRAQIALGPKPCVAPFCFQYMISEFADINSPIMPVPAPHCAPNTYWRATAFDATGPLGTNESEFSADEVFIPLLVQPEPPRGLRLMEIP
jgi:hypothetical protein